MENKTIALVVHLTNPANQDRIVQIARNFPTPSEFKFKVIFAFGKTIGEAFGKVHDDSYIKIFVTDSIVQLSEKIWSAIAYITENVRDFGVIGFLGSEIPIDGDISKAQSIFGSYTSTEDGESATRDNFREPYIFQEVQMLDPSLLVSYGIEIDWDSEISDEFIGAAICCRLKDRGLISVVAMSPADAPIAIFSEPNIYARSIDNLDEKSRNRFVNKYRRNFLPLVSILIPAYNQPEFFKLALESALSQDYQNLEILVGDDSTDDRVEKVIQPYLKRHKNIFYDRHEKSLGFNGRGNMQKLLEDCRGEFVQYLYHDDLLAPNKISRMMQIFQRDLSGEIAFVASERNLIDSDGNIVGKSPFQPSADTTIESQFLTRTILETCSNSIGELTTILFRKKDLWKNLDGIPRIGNFYGMQDDSMWDVSTFMEIGRKRGKIVFLEETLSAMRIHEDQNSQNPRVIITVLLDFLGFIITAFANRICIESPKQLKKTFDLWLVRQKSIRERVQTDWEKFFEEESDFETVTLKKILDALQQKNYHTAIHLTLTYLTKKEEIESFLDKFCRQEDGFWSLKDFGKE